MTKEVMWSQLEVGSLQAGIDLENRTQVLSSMTGDMQEALAAFLEKRPPRYGSTGAAEPYVPTARLSGRRVDPGAIAPNARVATLVPLMRGPDNQTRPAVRRLRRWP